jgi:arsenate reductase
MAEGFLRYLYGDRFEAYSAGIAPSRVNPYAVKAMAEVGVDISSHRSKSIQEFLGGKIDVAVTVCDEAKEACPFFPGASKQLHWSFPDPSEAKGREEEVLEIFRKVRDDIKDAIARAVEKGELDDP